ncbi:MAG TPA: MarR family winged helix-turn-helix transcriptional regulator [Gaiellaceae bacterium]|jgi:DNA-binding MarR family transcriptional regulator|nr:MarR family winged helix-turn-helix transcriptional regulator [Gaiellaceae bacterium]
MVISQLVRAPQELLKSPAFLLKRLGTIVKDKTMAAYEGAGASPYWYGVLAVLDEGARETQATIADALCYDRSYLVGVLDDLESAGLIERRRDPADRRRHVVSMTPAGKKVLVKLRALHERLDQEVFSVLTSSELKTLEELLGKLAAAHDPRYQV